MTDIQVPTDAEQFRDWCKSELTDAEVMAGLVAHLHRPDACDVCCTEWLDDQTTHAYLFWKQEARISFETLKYLCDNVSKVHINDGDGDKDMLTDSWLYGLHPLADNTMFDSAVSDWALRYTGYSFDEDRDDFRAEFSLFAASKHASLESLTVLVEAAHSVSYEETCADFDFAECEYCQSVLLELAEEIK